MRNQQQRVSYPVTVVVAKELKILAKEAWNFVHCYFSYQGEYGSTFPFPLCMIKSDATGECISFERSTRKGVDVALRASS